MRASARIRDLGPGDLAGVVRIDALHTGLNKPAYWARVLRDLPGRGKTGRRTVGRKDAEPLRMGLAIEDRERLIGYLVGEVRAFEFGSEACGWVQALAVDPEHLRGGVASALLAEACRRFRTAGVRSVRTMVGRSNVPVLSFFRASGFVGGSFVQIELDLEAG